MERSVLVPASVVLALACAGLEPTPTVCDGLDERLVGITRAEYAPCAGEMLAALDTLQRYLRRMVSRQDSAARPIAEEAYRRLRRLMGDVSFTADSWRELRGGAGPTTQRWPDGAIRYFNREIGIATAQYMSALRRPNAPNLQEGSRHHQQARSAYAQFR
jgi:hypothetical protein